MIRHVKNINKLENFYTNKECVIVGTGPSLSLMDLEFLKNRYFIAVNTFYKHAMSKHASLFVVCDDVVWKNHADNISKIIDAPIIVNTSVSPIRTDKIIPVKKLELFENQKIDLRNGLPKAETVVGTSLLLSYYLGFSKVYLIGCDCNYQNAHHFDGGKVDNFLRMNWEPVFKVYRNINKLYEENGREIINCTAGGDLEVFSRMNYSILI